MSSVVYNVQKYKTKDKSILLKEEAMRCLLYTEVAM